MAGLFGPTSSSMASASDPGMVTAEWITPRRTKRRISLAADKRELTVASMPPPPSSPTSSVFGEPGDDLAGAERPGHVTAEQVLAVPAGERQHGVGVPDAF